MKQKTIHLDMDGVVADWVGFANERLPTPISLTKPNTTASDRELLSNYPRMFSMLKLMPFANEYADLCRRFRDELDYQLVFLTAVPKDNNMPWAFTDKIDWARRYFPDIPVWFGPSAVEKQQKSGPGNILVDDNKKNCEQWEAGAGTAILVPAWQEHLGLDKLQQLFDSINTE